MAVLAYPWYVRPLGRIGRPSLSAGLTTTAVFLVVLLPLAGVSLALMNTLQDNAESVSEDVGQFLEPEGEGDSLATRSGPVSRDNAP